MFSCKNRGLILLSLSLSFFLALELHHYLATTDPPALRNTVVKLAATTKRLNTVNATLEALQTRINKIYAELSRQRIVVPGGSGGGRA